MQFQISKAVQQGAIIITPSIPMSTLPRSLAVTRNDIANIFLSSDHSGFLYLVDDAGGGTLNNDAAVDKTPITARIGVTILHTPRLRQQRRG